MIKLTRILFVLVCIMHPVAQAQERISLADGSSLNVFMVTPPAGTSTPQPLVILMGGGSGNASISQDTSRWLGSGFAARGWVVAVPVSPNNRSFRSNTNVEKIEQLIVELQKREHIASGQVLLAGVSAGGNSSLEIARKNPENYFGVAAIPALSSADTNNEALKDFPVYLRIGENDQLGWADRFDETVASLTAAGVNLDADILGGAPHMFRMDWSTLAPWLDAVKH